MDIRNLDQTFQKRNNMYKIGDEKSIQRLELVKKIEKESNPQRKKRYQEALKNLQYNI